MLSGRYHAAKAKVEELKDARDAIANEITAYEAKVTEADERYREAMEAAKALQICRFPDHSSAWPSDAYDLEIERLREAKERRIQAFLESEAAKERAVQEAP